MIDEATKADPFFEWGGVGYFFVQSFFSKITMIDVVFFLCKCMYTALTLCEIFSFPEIFFLKLLNTCPVPKSKSSRSQKETG